MKRSRSIPGGSRHSAFPLGSGICRTTAPPRRPGFPAHFRRSVRKPFQTRSSRALVRCACSARSNRCAYTLSVGSARCLALAAHGGDQVDDVLPTDVGHAPATEAREHVHPQRHVVPLARPGSQLRLALEPRSGDLCQRYAGGGDALAALILERSFSRLAIASGSPVSPLLRTASASPPLSCRSARAGPPAARRGLARPGRQLPFGNRPVSPPPPRAP